MLEDRQVKLYTRTGDDGTTGLLGGSRVRKDDLRVETYGTIDELNAHLGVARARVAEGPRCLVLDELASRIGDVQSELFALGAELAAPPPASAARSGQSAAPAVVRMDSAAIARLETWIDDASAAAPPLRQFVLPGGTALAAQLHVCRTVCRRAERRVVSLSARAEVDPHIVIYLNRLSDLLFAWARQANSAGGVADVPWAAPQS